MTELRLATEQDLGEIWALVVRAIEHMHALGNPQWGEDYPTADHYAHDIRRGELYVAIATVSSATDAYASKPPILGVACINTDQSPEYAPLPWRVSAPAMTIHRMAVDPAAQRQGVASAFFDLTEAMARQRGIAAVHMDTYAENARMQALVRGRGYQRVGEVHFCRAERPLGYPCFEKLLER